MPRGDYVVEFSDQGRWARTELKLETGGEKVLSPVWESGRAVEGDAKGRVVRLVVGPSASERELQRVDADGEFRLEGLPPRGELLLRVAGRTVKVPADSGAVYRIPD